MKKHLTLVLLNIFFGISCSSKAQIDNTKSSLSDKKATPETKILYKNLTDLSKKSILFGHQDDLAYGVNWKYEAGRSDVKEVTGDYPAVYGWDLAGLEKNQTKISMVFLLTKCDNI